ncbi:MAG: hypothetical protein J7M38_03970 [Armatimonadetes bacterium]|nr:hypothetical protein [Armatimonadota bacterium]
MPREVMERRAADNVYLHKDFHGALSAGLEYLTERYGEGAVRDYLRRFTLAYYAPVREQLMQRGLPALREHFAHIYEVEGITPRITATEDELVIEVDECPAVAHMREHGYAVARLWVETTRTVNEALVEGTPFAAELVQYHERTGASIQRFYRRDEA